MDFLRIDLSLNNVLFISIIDRIQLYKNRGKLGFYLILFSIILDIILLFLSYIDPYMFEPVKSLPWFSIWFSVSSLIYIILVLISGLLCASLISQETRMRQLAILFGVKLESLEAPNFELLSKEKSRQFLQSLITKVRIINIGVFIK